MDTKQELALDRPATYHIKVPRTLRKLVRLGREDDD
jgi:hypothetical protein